MTNLSDPTPLQFTAPGPGAWTLDATHFARPVTPFFAELFPDALKKGIGEGLRRYGALLDHLEFKFVHGVGYFAVRPVAAPKSAVKPPPRAVFKLLSLLHPEIRLRNRNAVRTFEQKPWREDLRRWDQEVKPAAIAKHLELQRVDVEKLDLPSLVAHLGRCREHLAAMVQLHHQYDLANFLPVGDFVVQASKWTGLPNAEVMELLRGASPVSLGGSDQRQRVLQALAERPDAVRHIEVESDHAAALRKLVEDPGELGRAMREYLEWVGQRPMNGFDVAAPSAIERPEVLLRNLRGARLGHSTELVAESGVNFEQARNRIRLKVPPEHREQFDELLEEARLMYRLRDERGLFSDTWASGIARKAILELGRRLTARGALSQPEHLLDATYAQMLQLAQGGSQPSKETLAERFSRREGIDISSAPMTLGPKDEGPPPSEWMTPAMARMMTALGLYVSSMLQDGSGRSGSLLKGYAASCGTYEGTARVVRGAEDFDRICQGDVLVATSMTAAFNVVLPMVGAIVTDRGGLLSHAAIVARECGIPAVVGTQTATQDFIDGARVRVNGSTGEATVIA
ncbi:MAG: PEP-utilizing enzyme [Myxococcaceae bacterium]